MVLNTELILELHSLYLKGTKYKDLQIISNSSRSTIRRAFLSYGLALKPPGNISSLDNDIVLKMYEEYKTGLSLADLSKIYNVSSTTIFRFFKKTGLQTRISDNESRQVNENTFDILRPEVLYWVGFLMSDGWVNCRNVIGVGANPVDAEQIYNFKEFVQGNQNVIFHSKRKFCYFQFTSKHAATQLERYGVTKNKSLTATPSPELLKSKDFWRGMIDGDGSLFYATKNNRPGLSLAGSYNCVNGFYNFCLSQLAIESCTVRPLGNIFTIRFTGDKAKQVANLLYSEAPSKQRLERKYQKYIAFLESK